MHDCSSCSGGCGGCARELSLTQQELNVLQVLGQIPFLAVARKAGDETPVCFEKELPQEQLSLILQLLEKKGLISLDYDCPLKNTGLTRYEGFPLLGSMALTARGQQVLELIELQGCNE